MEKKLKWSTNSPKREMQFVDEGAYQVDIVVAFFAVLLILLMVSAPQIARNITQPGLMTYRSKNPGTDTFMLRSFAALYPYRNIWAIRNGGIYEIDLQAISKRYALNPSLSYKATVKGAAIRITPFPGQVDSFKFSLTFLTTSVPLELTKTNFNLSEKDHIISSFMKSDRGSLIFVWENQLAAASPLFEHLRKRGYPHRIVVLDKAGDPIKITRSAKFYELEKIMRAY